MARKPVKKPALPPRPLYVKKPAKKPKRKRR